MKPDVLPCFCSLLHALQDFDAKIGPMGLYAAEEYQDPEKPQPRLQVEWDQCLKPALKAIGCQPIGRVNYERNRASIQFKTGGSISCLKVARLSKIKVRRYGNAYRVDPHHDFSVRWEEANLGGWLNDLAKFDSRPGSLLIFIGFATESEPFSAELNELQSGAAFQRKFKRATIRTWEDPHGRGFNVLAALWHVTAKTNSK